MAAQMASRGVTGSLDVLDGEVGLGHAMSNGPDWSQVGLTLGSDFHITRLTFKNHIGCGHTFAAIDAALALREQHGLQGDDIAYVQVDTYKPALDIACYEDPETANEARFSIRYVVATALTRGSVRLAAFEPEQLGNARTRDLMRRIDARIDPEIDAAFPGQRAARVQVTTRGGHRLVHFQPNRKGDPELPLSDAELDSKFMELSGPFLGSEKASRLLQRLRALEGAESLSHLLCDRHRVSIPGAQSGSGSFFGRRPTGRPVPRGHHTACLLRRPPIRLLRPHPARRPAI